MFEFVWKAVIYREENKRGNELLKNNFYDNYNLVYSDTIY